MLQLTEIKYSSIKNKKTNKMTKGCNKITKT